MDPLVVLGAVAAATTSVRLGTAVCLVAQRDPIILAKQIATLDRLSRGRVVFGVGAGWNDEEMHNHGTDPSRRFTLLRERIEAMTAIWTQEEATYSGKLVHFAPLWSWPKPVQRPAAAGPARRQRAAGTGPGCRLRRRVDPVPGRHQSGYRQRLRGYRGLRVRVDLADSRPAGEGGSRPAAARYRSPCSTLARIGPRSKHYRQMGIDRLVFWLPTEGRAATLRKLDGLAALAGLGA